MADQQQADDDEYYGDDEGYEEYDITTKDPVRRMKGIDRAAIIFQDIT